MNFFKKVGRPTEDEQMMIQSIQRIIEQKGIAVEQIPDCHSFEDLIELRTLLDTFPVSNQGIEAIIEAEHIKTEDTKEIEYIKDSDNVPEPEQINFDSESDTEVIEAEEKNEIKQESNSKTNAPKFVAEDYDPFADPIIERSYNQQQGNTGNQVQFDPDDDLPELEDSKETNLKDLNPATKRRAAEQTANAILKGYSRLAPQPFKWMAKVPEDKIEKLAFNGELDLSIEVSEGLTFDDYVKQTNEQIDEIFEVQEDTLDEIREPLIEVLMEQELELTPTQRLTMAVISHLAQMFSVALKLRQQNNRILSYQKHLTYLSRVQTA